MKKYINFLPNAITLANLSLGVIAILLAVSNNRVGPENQPIFISSLLVIFAGITDRLDGKVARILDATSELGKELDSLSDLISFGVAPIVIAWKVGLCNIGPIGYVIAIIFPLAGAYRLARYNIEEFNNVFKGIPITAAGIILSLVNLYYSYKLAVEKSISGVSIYVLVTIIVVLAVLMVSRLQIKKI